MVVAWGSGQLQDEHASLGNTFSKDLGMSLSVGPGEQN